AGSSAANPFTAASSTAGLFGGVHGGVPGGGTEPLIGSAVSVSNGGSGTIHILNAGTMRGLGNNSPGDPDESAVIQIASKTPTLIWNTPTGVIQPNGSGGVT